MHFEGKYHHILKVRSLMVIELQSSRKKLDLIHFLRMFERLLNLWNEAKLLERVTGNTRNFLAIGNHVLKSSACSDLEISHTIDLANSFLTHFYLSFS